MAATTFRWRNTSGDRQWSTVANWDQGVLPGTGGAGLDTVIFDGVSQADCYGYDGSGDSQLFTIVTTPAHRGNVGSDGNPLIHDINQAANGRITHRGSGQFFYEPKATFVNTDVVLDAQMSNVPNMTLTGDHRVIAVKRGWLSIRPAGGCDWLIVDGSGSYVEMEAASGGQKPWTIVVIGGRLDNRRGTSAEVYKNILATGAGGIINQYGLIHVNTTVLQLGGRINPLPVSQPATWPTLLHLSGFHDTGGSNYQIGYDNMVIGQLGNTSGPVGAYDLGKGVNINLRDDYP